MSIETTIKLFEKSLEIELEAINKKTLRELARVGINSNTISLLKKDIEDSYPKECANIILLEKLNLLYRQHLVAHALMNLKPEIKKPKTPLFSLVEEMDFNTYRGKLFISREELSMICHGMSVTKQIELAEEAKFLPKEDRIPLRKRAKGKTVGYFVDEILPWCRRHYKSRF